MKIFQNKNSWAICPACDKNHEILEPFDSIFVMICSLVSDLIYLGNTQTKAIRETVRKELLGL